ncbi:MAG: prepilin-type N-terminal cleavage/methylation domain-containing protein [Patescibacteria group bacterium]|jgi:type II secretion system protein G
MDRKRGFTLIELLVVIAIIGILATIIIISYNNAQAKARDNKRKVDLESIASALEMRYADKHRYSNTDHDTFASYVNDSADPRYWPKLGNWLSGYLSSLPQDPKVALSSYNGLESWNQSEIYSYGVILWPNQYCLTTRLETSSGNTAFYPVGGICGGYGPATTDPPNFSYNQQDHDNNKAYFIDKHTNR